MPKEPKPKEKPATQAPPPKPVTIEIDVETLRRLAELADEAAAPTVVFSRDPGAMMEAAWQASTGAARKIGNILKARLGRYATPQPDEN